MEQNTQKRKNIVSIMILTILVLCVVVIGFKYKSHKKEDLEKNKQNDLSSTIETQIKNEEAFAIETKYGKLFFPLKWKEYLQVKMQDEESYIVQFYGKIGNNKKQHLFDISFGGKEGTTIGYYTNKKEIININVIGKECNKQEEMTEEDFAKICGMQEDVNFLIGMIDKENNFTTEK